MKIDNKKWCLRLLIYSGFFLEWLKNTREFILSILTLIFLLLIAEALVWIIYKLFIGINYYGTKKPHDYPRDLKRFAIILSILNLGGLIIILLNILPPHILANWNSWMYVPGLLLFIPLLGIFFLKRWGLYFFILSNIVQPIMILIFDYKGLIDIVSVLTAFLLYSYYPYVRRNAFA